MREIKFRGKRVDTGEWVYGYFAVDTDTKTNYIIERIYWNCEECSDQTLYCEVDPSTVGQYTGLKDKNGKEIYEGDVINRRGGEYWQGCYEFDDTITISDLMDIVTTAEFESLLVIGNIHDNPDLLAANKSSE